MSAVLPGFWLDFCLFDAKGIVIDIIPHSCGNHSSLMRPTRDLLNAQTISLTAKHQAES